MNVWEGQGFGGADPFSLLFGEEETALEAWLGQAGWPEKGPCSTVPSLGYATQLCAPARLVLGSVPSWAGPVPSWAGPVPLWAGLQHRPLPA